MGYGDSLDADPYGDDVIVTRQSDMERKCYAEIGYRNHPGYLFVPSEPIVIGTTTHAGIEEIILAKPSEYDHIVEKWSVLPFVEEQIMAVMEADLEGKDIDPMSIIGSKWRLRNAAEEVSLAVREWHRTWWLPWGSKLEVLAVEETRRRILGTSPLTGAPLGVEGTGDLVVRGGMWDWKTSKKDWSPTKGIARPQSPLYTWLYEDLLETLTIPFSYLVWDRGKGKWATHTVHVDETQVEAAKRAAFQLALTTEAQSFPATPAVDEFGKVKRGWYCSTKYCAAWEVCEFKGLVVDGADLDAPQLRTWAA